MDVHASPAKLPALQTCLDAFQVRFRRPEGRAALARYTTGLLTELPNKNSDTIAQAVPGTSAQRWQACLTNMQWDEEDFNRQRVAKMIAEATTGDGVLVFDDTGFPTRGTALVGVARQYSGTLGKVGNCQMAVTCCYTDPQATWPVAVQFYLPKTWAYAPERWQHARVSPEVTFQTTPELALALLDQARAWGVPHRCVVADADYGDHPNFLAGLEARQEPYVVAVRTDFSVRLGHSGSTPVWRRMHWSRACVPSMVHSVGVTVLFPAGGRRRESEAPGRRREAGSAGSVQHTRGLRDKHQRGGVTPPGTSGHGTTQSSLHQRGRGVNLAAMRGRRCN